MCMHVYMCVCVCVLVHNVCICPCTYVHMYVYIPLSTLLISRDDLTLRRDAILLDASFSNVFPPLTTWYILCTLFSVYNQPQHMCE